MLLPPIIPQYWIERICFKHFEKLRVLHITGKGIKYNREMNQQLICPQRDFSFSLSILKFAAKDEGPG